MHENRIFRRVRKIANRDSFVMSVCPSLGPSLLLPAWINSAPAGRIFIQFYIYLSYKSVDIIQVLFKTDSNGYFT